MEMKRVREGRGRGEWIQRTFMCFLALHLIAGAASTAPAVECALDDDQSNAGLDRCLERGESFLRKYHNKLLRGTLDDHYNKCGEYEKFRSCILAYREKCPNIAQLTRHDWLHVINMLDCSCGYQDETCAPELACAETELSGVFGQRCEEYHEFNIRQKPNRKCDFLQHKLHCKHGLVDSACGGRAGNFTAAWAQIIARKKNCVLRKTQHKAFRYTDVCPRNITKSIQTCAEKSFAKDRGTIYFFEHNSLIADHGKKDVKKGCVAYKHYKRCIRPVKDACPEGMRQAFEYQPQTRAYMFKMDFICQEAKEDYLENLRCYQRTHNNGTLDECQPIWDEIELSLERVNAVSFFCMPEHSGRNKLLRDIEKLRQCYQKHFTNFCGEVGGSTMGRFISKVFTDPVYLRYAYKPDCALYGRPSPPVHKHTTSRPKPPVVKDKEPTRVIPPKKHREPEPRSGATTQNNMAARQPVTWSVVGLGLTLWICLSPGVW